MNITFTPQQIPELTIDGGMLAGLGFTPGTSLQLTLRSDGLWINVVTDNTTWELYAKPVSSGKIWGRIGCGRTAS